MASVSISCPSCSATDGVVRTGIAVISLDFSSVLICPMTRLCIVENALMT
ncbi:IS1 family transposase [Escherichia coli]